MLDVLIVLARSVLSMFQARRELALENVALRHQLNVLKRRHGAKRPRVGRWDRALWIWLRRAWTSWRQALVIVRADTVVRWHRRAFRWYWDRKSRASRAVGRPTIAPDVIALIGQMAMANPLWGAPRIHGELGKLGIVVAPSTVAIYLPKHRKPPSLTWRAFLGEHAAELAAIDFFTVPTASMRVLYVMLVLSHDRRRVVHFNVTANPTAMWTAQQVVAAFPWETAPRFLLRDRDSIYGTSFRDRIEHLRIEEVVSAPRSPWQNPFVERLIGSVRRECLDHRIVLNKRHLLGVLKNYFAYYHVDRTHLSLGKDAPEPRSVEPADLGNVVALPRAGGIHHRYVRRAA